MLKHAEILLVEDEKIVAMDIESSLKSFGYTVSSIISSGEEAIKKVEETKPDLVLMDIKLKGKIDGIEAVRQIRNRFDIPVVYLTSYADESTLQRAKITKPFGYILKPIEARELRTSIEIALYRNKMEKKLKENERWLTTILKSINDAVIATDTHGLVTFMNIIAEVLTGWRQKDALGKDITELFTIVNGTTPATAENPVRKVLREGKVIEEVNHSMLIAKAGLETPIDYSVAPIRNNKKRITGVVLVFRDITERKKTDDELKKAYAELKKMQQELIQSEKLAALGRFSSGVAHEIKNPLGIILGGIEFLEMKLLEPEEDIKTAIEKIKESTFRADSILQGLLKFAPPSELKVEKIRPDDLIKNTLSLLKFRTPLRNIKIDTHFTKEKLYIQVDKNQMQQVLFNLLMNAIEAMPKRGKITIESYRAELSGLSPDKSGCAIEIKDTGEGIPKENLPKLFEPFFTTKRDRKGTGLGLSMVEMIIKNHKGNLVIESEPGKGTNVKVILPLRCER